MPSCRLCQPTSASRAFTGIPSALILLASINSKLPSVVTGPSIVKAMGTSLVMLPLSVTFPTPFCILKPLIFWLLPSSLLSKTLVRLSWEMKISPRESTVSFWKHPGAGFSRGSSVATKWLSRNVTPGCELNVPLDMAMWLGGGHPAGAWPRSHDPASRSKAAGMSRPAKCRAKVIAFDELPVKK